MTLWRDITDRDVQQVVALWNRCKLTRAWNDPVTDIGYARRGPASTVLVREDQGQIVGALMVGHDGHRGALYYVGVDPAHRGKGFGREALVAAEAWLAERGCWKVNIMVREDNPDAMSFWEKMDYGRNTVTSLGKNIRR